MKHTETARSIVGFFTMVLGVALMGYGAYRVSDTTQASTTKHVLAAASGLTGFVLTFGVSRRLLTAPREE